MSTMSEDIVSEEPIVIIIEIKYIIIFILFYLYVDLIILLIILNEIIIYNILI